jgi:hypothetical protein
MHQRVYTVCIKECVETQKGCRVAYPNLPEDQKCDCQLVQNGEWDENKPRTFDTICNGDLAKSDGFVPLSDAQNTFIKSSKAVWEAQQECKRPYIEDITLDNFHREKHGIKNFVLDPANGPIYQGVDFGGTNPHAVEWGQFLRYEVRVLAYDGTEKLIPEGAFVLFDEAYISEIGNEKLGRLVISTERDLMRESGKFLVSGRFADPQAKSARLAWGELGMRCSWPVITRDKEELTKVLRDRIEDGLFYVSLDNCPMFIEEVEAWNIRTAKRQNFDHAVDATLYLVANAEAKEKREGGSQEGDLPDVRNRTIKLPNQFNDDNIPVHRGGRQIKTTDTKLPDDESWRNRFN